MNEVGNVGFNVYAQTLDGLKKINHQLIPSKRGDSLTPQHYSFTGSVPSDATSFFISDVDVRARDRVHGPFQLGEVHGKRGQIELINWEAIRSEHIDLENKRGEKIRLTGVEAAAPGGGGGGGTQYPPTELRVSSEGIYRVTYGQLKAAGIEFAAASSSALALTLRGVAVPIKVQGSTADPGNLVLVATLNSTEPARTRFIPKRMYISCRSTPILQHE